MKKILAVALAVMMVFGVFAIGAASEDLRTVRIRIDGSFVNIPANDQSPVIVENRTLVPLRAVMEALDFDVEWNEIGRFATLTDDSNVVTIGIGGNYMHVNHIAYRLDVPAQIINNRTMVPVRAISEATGFDIQWDGQNSIVDIRTDLRVVETPQEPEVPAEPEEPAEPTEPETPNEPAEPEESETTQQGPTVTVGNGSGLVISGGNNPVIVLPDGTEVRPNEPQQPNEPQTPPTPEEQNVVSSAIMLPNRVLTADEMNAWQEEFNALGGANAFELEVVWLVNVERANVGLPPLAASDTLMMAARFKSQSMASLNYMAHDGVYGGPGDLMRAFGFNPGTMGENIARGQTTPAQVVQSWMNSDGHRANILSTSFLVIGVGAYANANGQISWTQMFSNNTAD